ncbi:hypothetical protein Tco_0246707 [Tanacetum coccineum]
MPQLVLVSNIARFDQVVITLASGDTGQGFDLHSLQGRKSFSTFGRTKSKVSTFGRDVDSDFGLKPFRVFNVWLEVLDFNQVVKDAWKKEERFGGNRAKIKCLRNEAMRWELEAEKRTLSDVERETWLEMGGKEMEYCNML